MQLTNSFTVALPVDQTWQVVKDLERVMPCFPGGSITSVDGDEHHGDIKIKVGPVSTTYKGVARYTELDEQAKRAVIHAKGRDAGGQGQAEATFTVNLTPQGEGTQAELVTDLELQGRVAQFGRGVVADVVGKLLAQFARNLQAQLDSAADGQGAAATGTAAGGSTPVAGAAATAQPVSGSVETAPTQSSGDSLDALALARSMAPSYALPALAAVAALAVGGLGLSRLGRRGQRGTQGSVTINLVFPTGAAPSWFTDGGADR